MSTPQGFVIENVSLAGKEELGLYFRENLIDTPQITQLGFEVLAPSRDAKIYLHDRLGKSMRASIGCGWRATEGTNIYAKDIELKEMEIAYEQCYKEFEQTFLSRSLRTGNERANVEGTEIATIINQLLQESLTQESLRVLFLSDKSLMNEFYNAFDGVFKQLLAGTTNGDGVVNVGAITATDLNTTNIVNTLFQFKEAQDRDLLQIPDEDKRFIVSPNVYKALKKFYASTQYLESSRLLLINGQRQLEFDGTPIIVNNNAEQFLKADFPTSTGAKCENFIILTKPESHKLLLDVDSAQFETWYEIKERKNYFRTNFRLGYTYDYGTLSVIGGIESL